MITSIFKFNDCPVTFSKDECVMVNATEMAKPFGKLVKDWLKTEQSVRMINAIAEGKNLLSADLVIVKKGGNDKMSQGTWMHEDAALEFARWLSPAFAIWCNDKIKELLTTGSTSLVTPSYQIEDPIARAEAWIAEKKAMLALENKVKEDTPKVEYFNDLIDTEALTGFRDAAKELGVGQKKFIQFLTDNKYVYRDATNTLKPYMKHVPKLFVIKDYVNANNKFSGMRTLITIEGKKLFNELLNK